MSFRRASVISSFGILLLYGLLILSLFYFFRGSLFLETLFSERTLFSIKLSLAAASLAAFLSVLIAVPSAYALSRFTFRGKRIVDTALEFPMIVSPAALGAMVLIFFNNPLGVWVQDNVAGFVFAFPGIVLAQFITTAGVATRLVKASLDEIPPRYESVARSLGATPLKAFLTVTVPLARRGIIAAFVLTWAKALGEFGATITVAGSMAMKTETLPVAIFMRLASADIEGTVILILILTLTGIGVLYGFGFLSRGRKHA